MPGTLAEEKLKAKDVDKPKQKDVATKVVKHNHKWTLAVDRVVVHPLVLLSVVDHFNRVSKTGNVKRVIGVLLGSVKPGRILDIANSFAVPFDEDDKDGGVWFMDDDYLESMYTMFHKVAAKEKIVGWYHTGPKLHPNDIPINDQMKKFCREPVLVIVDAKPKKLGLPTEAYIQVEQIHDDGTPTEKTFEHLPSEIGAEEAEEVGVEHLLRDIKDQTAGTLSQQITNQVRGLHGLRCKLLDVAKYLSQVENEKLPVNHQIIYLLQDALSLLPDVTSAEFGSAANEQGNDQMLCLYIGSLTRSIAALHDLIDNKVTLRELEKVEKDGAGGDAGKKDKDKDIKDDKKDGNRKDGKEKDDKEGGGDSKSSTKKSAEDTKKKS